MREKNIQINLRLSENEKKLLEQNAAKCNLNSSEYIRILIKGYVPREAPTEEFFKLCSELSTLNTLLINGNQKESSEKLCKLFLELKAVTLLPTKIKSGG